MSPLKEQDVNSDKSDYVIQHSAVKLEKSQKNLNSGNVRMTQVPMQRRHIPELSVNAFDNRRN